MSGGGGNSSNYYNNLDVLYGKQGEQLDRLMGIQDRVVIPGYQGLYDESRQAGGIDEQNAAAARVIGQGRSEIAANRDAVNRDLMSMGVNPNDRRFVGLNRGNEVSGAAQIAGAANAARQGIKNTGFAKRKDVISMGMGVPSQASEQMSAMGNTLNTQISQRNQQQAANNAGLSSLATLGTMALMMRDGGKVRRGYRSGGKVCGPKAGIRMAGGGFIQPVVPSPPPSGVNQQQRGAGIDPTSMMVMQKGVQRSGGIAAIPENLNAAGGHLAAKIGNVAGNQELTNMGVERVLTSRGLDAGSAHELISGAEGLAPVQSAAAVDAGASGAARALGTTGAEVAGGVGAVGAETAGTAAAAGAVEGAAAGAAGSGTAALGAVSAAMPWIGAGLAVASLFGADLFADGGAVRRKDMRGGGYVSGKGTSTSDSIPAHLSDGEYVLNAEAVKMIGEHKLDAINDAGLAARRGGVRMAGGGFIQGAGSVADGIIRGMGISRQMQSQDQETRLRNLQMEQAQMGISRARSQQEEDQRRSDGLKAVNQAQAQFLNGRDPTQLSDNDVQSFRSLTASELVKNNLLDPGVVAEQLSALKRYADEGRFKAVVAFAESGGDKSAALSALKQLGIDASDIQVSRAKGADRLPDQMVNMTLPDGSVVSMSVSDLAIANGVGEPYIERKKAQIEAEKTAAMIDYSRARAQELRDRWKVRRDIADEQNATRIAASGIRGSVPRGTQSGNSSMYGMGEKEWAKWQEDLNAAQSIPQSSLKDAEGNPVMKGMNEVYVPDPSLMPKVFDMARANRMQIDKADVSPSEFGHIATSVLQAAKVKDPSAMYDALDQTGKFVIAVNKKTGKPIGASILLGPDKDDPSSRVLMRVPKAMEDALVKESVRRWEAGYVDEGSRMGVPGVVPQQQENRPLGGSRSRSGIIMPNKDRYSDEETRRILGG